MVLRFQSARIIGIYNVCCSEFLKTMRKHCLFDDFWGSTKMRKQAVLQEQKQEQQQEQQQERRRRRRQRRQQQQQQEEEAQAQAQE